VNRAAPTRAPAVRTIVRRLEKAYGKRVWKAGGTGRPPPNGDRPLDSLVGTILSQNTTARNAHAAMRQLKAAFPDWGSAAEAPLSKIAAAIRPAGLHRQKAKNISGLLRIIRQEHGCVSLNFLRRRPTDHIKQYLARLPGVGPKTAACVLLFALKRPVLPVDTHVRRVSRRLGLIGPKTSAEKAHDVLAEMVPDALVYAFHVLLIEHGRRICRARRPDCPACVLERLCPSAYKATGAGGRRQGS